MRTCGTSDGITSLPFLPSCACLIVAGKVRIKKGMYPPLRRQCSTPGYLSTREGCEKDGGNAEIGQRCLRDSVKSEG